MAALPAPGAALNAGALAKRHEAGMAQAASEAASEDDIAELEREYGEVLAGLRAQFRTGKTKSLEWRVGQLKALRRGMVAHADAVAAAVRSDLGRHNFEGVLAEVLGTTGEIDHIVSELGSWVQPEKVWHPLMVQPGSSQIQYEPKGVVLVLSPWNYPVNLTMLSLVAALSAGNCALIKPSEVAPASAAIIEKIVKEYLDGDCVKVVQGAVPETTALLRLHWDHIIYTGNGAVARVVMRAASKHLTPCTLELGGKSPVYVDKSAKLSVAVKRLLAGKGMNNGQTCIAPDHVFVHEAVQEAFLKELLSTLRAFYGENPRTSASYGRIVNHRHWDRVARLMKPESHKGQVLCGGLDKSVREDKYIAPTVILNPSLDSPLMSEEIFGFVLPVITVKGVEQAIERVASGEHPLALYVFSEDQAVTDKVLQGTTSGGVCVNDTLYHIVNPYLPFGGIGSSGMGAYHGKHGFVEMSHKKAVMYRSTFIDAAFRYPPYSDKTANALKGFAAKEPMDPNTKKLIMTAAAAAFGAVVMSRL